IHTVSYGTGGGRGDDGVRFRGRHPPALPHAGSGFRPAAGGYLGVQRREVWQVQKLEDGYEVDAAEGSKYMVRLVRLNEYEFVDVASKSDPEVGVAGHLFGKIRMVGDDLYVSLIDETWLKHMVEAGLAPQSTVGEGQQIVLTAPTSELQKFILLHAADPGAWDNDEEGLHRVH